MGAGAELWGPADAEEVRVGVDAVAALVATLLLAAGGLAALAVVARRRLAPPGTGALRTAVRRARRERRTARRAHARDLAPARAAVRRERRRHDAAVRRAHERIRALEDPRGRVLASVGPVVLHERVVVTPGGVAPVAEVRAIATSEGGVEVRRRPTLTRAAIGAAAFGAIGALGSFALQKRERLDGRRIRLVVEAGAASVIVELRHDALRDVQRFLGALERTAAEASAVGVRRAAELADARRALAALEGDPRGLAAATAELERRRVDPDRTAARDAAERSLDEARAALRAARRAARRTTRGTG